MANPLTRLHAVQRQDRCGPLPVIVVSGFLGSGKTELVSRLVLGGAPRRLAWLVQSLSGRRDGAAGVADAAWWRIAERLDATDGCVCCALRHDLVAGIEAAAADPTVDVLVVESAGTVMPAPATEAVCALGELPGLVRMHAAVTVVDTASFLGDLESDDHLRDLGFHACGENHAVAGLRIAQVEHADIVVVRDNAPRPDVRHTVRALVHRLNPRAQVVLGEVDAHDIIDCERFDATATPRAAEHAQTLAPASAAAPDEHGVSTVRYQTRRPFHPARLVAALDVPLPGLLRARGAIWIATRPDVAMRWQQAGPTLFLQPAWSWLAGRRLDAWRELDDAERATALIDWDRDFGDRAQDLAFIGLDLDAARLRATLDACLLTDAELAGGPPSWCALPDPFPAWDPADIVALPLRRPVPPLLRSHRMPYRE